VNCTVSDFTIWSVCSAPCDGGLQHQTRTVLTQAQNGGMACPDLFQERVCNNQSCVIVPPRGVGAPSKNGGPGIAGNGQLNGNNGQTAPSSGKAIPYWAWIVVAIGAAIIIGVIVAIVVVVKKRQSGSPWNSSNYYQIY